MGIIKWLNSHAVPATIFYFALMGGIAWGVNQSIADRTALEAMPADGDLIAIYDLDATAGKSIAVSTFRGDNLNAIVNAEAGVVSPTITMYDDNGTSTGTAAIYGTTVDGDYDVVMSLGVEVGGSTVSFLELDGINETVDILKPLDAGTKWTLVTQADLDLSSATNCSGQYYFAAASTGDGELILPDEPRCQGIAASSKVYHLHSFDDGAPAAYDLDISPQTGDVIYLDGIPCATSAALELDDVGDWAIISGYDSTVWVVTAHVGATCTR